MSQDREIIGEIIAIIFYLGISFASLFVFLVIGIAIKRSVVGWYKMRLLYKTMYERPLERENDIGAIRDYVEQQVDYLYRSFYRPKWVGQLTRWLWLILPFGFFLIMIFDHFDLVGEFDWKVYAIYLGVWTLYSFWAVMDPAARKNRFWNID